ncbi:MAG: bifunctional UDP-N-acetylglucosamine diphosphorylase/glucosamine-1-phosphate N-acetyltransferase GlmU [Pseudomonadota bacterium]|nr:MAG: bifunctional UDP-N-acetylglucosamine diphosphorylase/glucosamine-1-phosphate N-acetyltransferase GlmU [Pseudomonadota bacterium]
MNVIVLAAGQGTRMKSDLPKVLHPLGARPLLQHVLDTARALRPERLVVVYGHGGQRVVDNVPGDDIIWAEQAEQLGTGHAVAQGVHELSDEAVLLVLYGDVPLTGQDTLARLVNLADTQTLGLLTVNLTDPTGYGRIIRDADGEVTAIREQKDTSEAERQIGEVNTGILAVSVSRLRAWLDKLDNDNAQGEYYLTDIVALAVADGVKIKAMHPHDVDEVLGVNSKSQLAHLERVYQERCAEVLMTQGVTLMDPARIDIRGEVEVGRDVTLDVNVVLLGKVLLGSGVTIGAGCVLRDVEIGDGVEVLPMSVIEEARIGDHSRIGPYSRIRPGTVLAAETHVGNFVEIKNSQVGNKSKINHLSYVGDSSVGARVNVGAGTITCNYDGANKHRTDIGDDVFIGSDTQLVAPVKVGDSATIGAGSTITRDVPPQELTLSRSKQVTLPGWKRPVKKK